MYLYWIVAAVVLVVIVIAVRRARSPSVRVFGEIDAGLVRIQRHAIGNVASATDDGTIRPLSVAEMRESSFNVDRTISFAYTAEQREGGYLHLVSSKLMKPRPAKYQVECMLVAMLVLNRELEQAGLGSDDVGLGVDESETGTQYISLELTPEQHDLFCAAIRS